MKKPTKNKKDASDVIVLSFEDLLKAVEDLNLSKKNFKDVHGGFRLSDNLSPIADFRPAKTHIRWYPGRDGLVKAMQIKNKKDLEKAKKIMVAIIDGRIIKNKKITGYKFNDFTTENKKEFVEHLIKVI